MADKKEETTEEKVKNSKKADGVKLEAKVENLKDIVPSKESKEEFLFPAFFIEEKNRVKVSLDVLFDKSSGKIVSITKAGVGIDFAQFTQFGRYNAWFEFTQPNYDDISIYRQRSGIFNATARMTLIDTVLLRKHLIVWHLKDWSLCDNKGNKIELEFDGATLSEETQKIVFNAFPSLIDVAISNFEKDVVLV